MATWLATGPPGIACAPTSLATAGSSGVAAVSPVRFWTTPPSDSSTATANDSGSSTRSIVRVRSTQKLPSVRRPLRTMPRMIATATTMPAAAETKFCTVSAIIWVRWLMVDSPAYHCQFVFVMKLTATLNAPNGATLETPVGLSGRCSCTRWSTYTTRNDSRLNASKEMA